MQVVRKNGIAIYFLVLAMQCFSIYAGWEPLRMISKIVLIPILTLHLFAVAGTAVSILVYTAFLFAYLGDLALLQKGDIFFLAGMAAFIVSHICNSICFLRLQDKSHTRLREAFAAAIILMLVSAIMFGVLNPYLGKLRLPVLCYMVIISIMSILAANTAGNERFRSLALGCFIPGAALFVVSDSLLALNKFVFNTMWLNMAVMLTYGLAQYFLAKGFAKAAVRF
jgi:uncharacterized membrane protein YhhN